MAEGSQVRPPPGLEESGFTRASMLADRSAGDAVTGSVKEAIDETKKMVPAELGIKINPVLLKAKKKGNSENGSAN